jgi:ATP-dependent helicase/nuclease subunit B
MAINLTEIPMPLALLRTIDDAMRNGLLPAAPRKDGCKRCEYLPICGPYEEERVGEKLAIKLTEHLCH